MQNHLDKSAFQAGGAWSLPTSKREDCSQLLDLRLAPLNQNEVLSLEMLPDSLQKHSWSSLDGLSEDKKLSSLTILTSKEGAPQFPETPYNHNFGFLHETNNPSNSLKLAHSPIQEGNTPTSASAKSKAIRYISSSEDIDDSEDADGSFKRKLRLDKEQFALLEEIFMKHQRLAPKHKAALAKQLNVRTRQIEVWFQNRRARTKVKQTEMEREKLKSNCDALTEENRRLQALVQELKASQAASASMLRNDFWNHSKFSVSVCPSCQKLSTVPPNASNSYDELPNAIVIHQNVLERQPLNLL